MNNEEEVHDFKQKSLLKLSDVILLSLYIFYLKMFKEITQFCLIMSYCFMKILATVAEETKMPLGVMHASSKLIRNYK